jgi:hypothetical protein
MEAGEASRNAFGYKRPEWGEAKTAGETTARGSSIRKVGEAGPRALLAHGAPALAPSGPVLAAGSEKRLRPGNMIYLFQSLAPGQGVFITALP